MLETVINRANGVTFYPSGDGDIMHRSVVTVTNSKSKNQMTSDSQMSPLLGITQHLLSRNIQVCPTCQLPIINTEGKPFCGGHTGMVKLPINILNPLYINAFKKVIKSICFHCNRSVVGQNQCPNCKKSPPKSVTIGKKDKDERSIRPDIITLTYKNTTEDIPMIRSIDDVARILDELSNEDVWKILRKSGPVNIDLLRKIHPRKYITNKLPILPTYLSDARYMNDKIIPSDENNLIIRLIDDCNKYVQHPNLSDSVSYQKHLDDYRMKIYKTIEEILVKSVQSGRGNRGNDNSKSRKDRNMGKKGNFRRDNEIMVNNNSGRAVISMTTENANIVVISENTAAKMWKTEDVTPYRLAFLESLNEMGKIHAVVRGDRMFINRKTIQSVIDRNIPTFLRPGDVVIRADRVDSKFFDFGGKIGQGERIEVTNNNFDTIMLMVGDTVIRNNDELHPLTIEISKHTREPLQEGDIVYRHGITGDPVNLHRNPVINPYSKFSSIILVVPSNPTVGLEGKEGLSYNISLQRTIGLTNYYNNITVHDYDGDEININVPNIIMSHIESILLLSFEAKKINMKNYKPILENIQSDILGVYYLALDRKVLNPNVYQALLDYVPGELEGDTTFDALSILFPDTFDYVSDGLTISKGLYLGGSDNIVKHLSKIGVTFIKNYPISYYISFIKRVTILSTIFLFYESTYYSMRDFILNEEEKDEALNFKMKEFRENLTQLKINGVKRERIETAIYANVDSLYTVGRNFMIDQIKESPIFHIPESGSKGNIDSIVTMTSMLTNRIPSEGYIRQSCAGGRSSYLGLRDEIQDDEEFWISRGFVSKGLRYGLNSLSLSIHGLKTLQEFITKYSGTAPKGYIQRKYLAIADSIVCTVYGTQVRISTGEIIQNALNDLHLDPERLVRTKYGNYFFDRMNIDIYHNRYRIRDDKRVPLTYDQIEDILEDVIEPILYLPPFERRKVRNLYMKIGRLVLGDCMIYPPLIPSLKKLLNMKYFQARTVPGTPYCTKAAELQGEIGTQATLKAIHGNKITSDETTFYGFSNSSGKDKELKDIDKLETIISLGGRFNNITELRKYMGTLPYTIFSNVIDNINYFSANDPILPPFLQSFGFSNDQLTMVIRLRPEDLYKRNITMSQIYLVLKNNFPNFNIGMDGYNHLFFLDANVNEEDLRKLYIGGLTGISEYDVIYEEGNNIIPQRLVIRGKNFIELSVKFGIQNMEFNSLVDIVQFLGVDTFINYARKQLRRQYTSPEFSHIVTTLMLSMMTHSGQIFSLSRTLKSKLISHAPIANSCFEETTTTLIRAAVSGRTDYLLERESARIMGLIPMIGTGYSRVSF